MESQEIRLRRRPSGMPTEDDFELATVTVGEPADGQVRVRNEFMSVDPYMRGRMVDRKSYIPPFAVGEVLSGGAVGVVVDSAHPDFAPGDHVLNGAGWRQAFCADGKHLDNLGPDVTQPSAYLGILGMPGQTAYVGLLEIGALADGETVFVSGAAGAVGSVVGQIAKLKGCRVVGSAGSSEKVAWLTDELGFDAAFNYRDGDLAKQLHAAAPGGIDVYFDNVGGDHLEAALTNMREFGRVAMCGAISQYNETEATPAPRNLALAIGKSLTLRGFIVSRYDHLKKQFRTDMSEWLETGQITYSETVVEGIDHAPSAFIGLFTGGNTGKMIVDVR